MAVSLARKWQVFDFSTSASSKQRRDSSGADILSVFYLPHPRCHPELVEGSFLAQRTRTIPRQARDDRIGLGNGRSLDRHPASLVEDCRASAPLAVVRLPSWNWQPDRLPDKVSVGCASRAGQGLERSFDTLPKNLPASGWFWGDAKAMGGGQFIEVSERLLLVLLFIVGDPAFYVIQALGHQPVIEHG